MYDMTVYFDKATGKYFAKSEDTAFAWIDDIHGGDTPIEALDEIGDLELNEDESKAWKALHDEYSKSK